MYPELRRHRELSAGRFPRGPRAVTVPSAQPAQPCPLLTPAPCCRELSQPSVTLPGDCTGAVTACAAQTHPLYPSCSSEHPREGLCPPDSEPPPARAPAPWGTLVLVCGYSSAEEQLEMVQTPLGLAAWTQSTNTNRPFTVSLGAAALGQAAVLDLQTSSLPLMP